MAQSGDYRAACGAGLPGYGQWNPPGGSWPAEQFYSPGRAWRAEQFDLQAYSQQLSYPQLLAPGRPQPSHAVRDVLGGLAVALIGISRRRLRAG